METGTLIGEVGDAQPRANSYRTRFRVFPNAAIWASRWKNCASRFAADPNYAPAYNVLGLVHMDLRENAGGAEHFERAARLAANDPDINNNYGWFLCRSGREEQSIALFPRGLEEPLYNTPARSLCQRRAVLHRQERRAQDAIEYFERALRSEPDNLLALLNPRIDPVQARSAGSCARIGPALQ